MPGWCRGGGMADAMDSKSIDRKVVRVRLSPAAPSGQVKLGLTLHHVGCRVAMNPMWFMAKSIDRKVVTMYLTWYMVRVRPAPRRVQGVTLSRGTT